MSYYAPIAYDLINYYPNGNISPLGTAAKNKIFVVDSPVYPSVVLSDSSIPATKPKFRTSLTTLSLAKE